MTGGEGLLHKQACRDWQKYLVGQVSDCAECHIMGIHVGDHLHPSTNVEGKTSLALKHSKIIWLCAQCLKPHKWDLLDNGACEVLQNKKAPGFSVRPDITLVNSEGRPTAFIEFHDSHLSRKAVAVAKEHSIPLFVVDIKRTLDEFQMGLQNPQRGMWQAWAEATGVNPNKSDLWADRMNYRAMESLYGRDHSAGLRFAAIPDGQGGLADVVLHIVGQCSRLPMPSRGPFLLGSWSTLSCDSQKRWLAA